MWYNFSESEELVLRELYKEKGLSVTEISKRANLPTWKVSRNLKRLEIDGIVRHTDEERKKRGRPCKFYEITSAFEGRKKEAKEVIF